MTDPEPRTDAVRRDAMQELLRACAPGAFEVGACPAESTLTAFQEGVLPAAERAEVERHLAGCARCFQALEAAMDARFEDEPPRRGLLRRLPRWLRGPFGLATAALLLAVVTAAILWSQRSRDRGDPAGGQVTDAQLTALIASLEKQHPRVFAGLRGIGADERREARLPRVRGEAVALTFPRGTVMDLRPAFTWWPAAGSTAISIELLTRDLEPVWQRPVAGAVRLPYPADLAPLAPAADHLWRLVYSTPFTERATAIVAFRCARDAERAAHTRALEIIAAAIPAPNHHLVSAHYAARNDLLGSALAHARAFVAARPGSRLGRETLRYVLVLLRSPEADRVLTEAGTR